MPKLARIVSFCIGACMVAVGLPACSETDPQAGNTSAQAASAGAASSGAPARQLTALAEIGPLAEGEGGVEGGVEGEVRFEQLDGFVRIEAEIRGLADGLYGFHVHGGRDCVERGDHYDPTGSAHGSPDETAQRRHVGDLGNLVSRDGVARYLRNDPMIALEGMDAVLGRVVVIHDGEDQFLPQPAGDSGTQIGCGVIEAGSGA